MEKNCQEHSTKERGMGNVSSRVNPKVSEGLREPGQEICWKAWPRLNQQMDQSLKVGSQVLASLTLLTAHMTLKMGHGTEFTESLVLTEVCKYLEDVEMES